MKKAALFVNEKTDKDLIITRRIIDVLTRSGCRVYTKGLLDDDIGAGELLTEEAAFACDAGIVVGGDGTMLKAVHFFSEWNIPVFGVNRGTMGFLTDVAVGDIDGAIAQYLAGKYTLEERMMIKLYSKNRNYGKCLNEVMFKHRSGEGVGSFRIASGGVQLANFSGDGVLIVAPTGSTAYSLSAGGPLVSPDCKVMLIQPIAPHSFFNRSIILSDREVVSVAFERNVTSVCLDGEEVEVQDDILYISKSEKTARFIRLDGYDFYKILFEKIR